MGAVMNNELQSGFSKEIFLAMEVDKASKSRKFPRLKCFARLIRDNLHIEALSRQEWLLLADFLDGTHRGHPGHKNDKEQKSQDDIKRAELFAAYSDKIGRTGALEKLAKREKLQDIRSIEKAIKRGIKYLQEDIEKLQKEADKYKKLSDLARENHEKQFSQLSDLLDPHKINAITLGK
jgi:hypothetical protein